MSGRLALAARTLAAEGPRAVLDRALDHLAYWQSRPRARELVGSKVPKGFRTPVLHLLSTPPKPWFGGVQVHVARRRELESARSPFVLLFPESGRYRLEIWHGESRRAWRLGPAAEERLSSLHEPDLERSVRQAAEWLGAEILHVENLAGLPLGSVLRLVEGGLRTVVSVHDFAAFCPRPHLIEQPDQRFCHYSRDLGRCARCLGLDPEAGADFQRTRRDLAGRLLSQAEAVVYPSAFLRDQFQVLFPGLGPVRQLVRPPRTALDPRPASRAAPTVTPSGRVRIAFVGSARPHKGSRVLAEVVDGLSAEERRRFLLSAYGGGDLGELAAWSRRGVEVRGYYRASRLPERLRRDQIDLALLPSIYPEPYGLTLDECLAAGVAVVAFDHGAMADRLRLWGGGWLVPPQEGAAGIVRLLRELPAREAWPRPALPEAGGLLDYEGLYRQALGGVIPSGPSPRHSGSGSRTER